MSHVTGSEDARKAGLQQERRALEWPAGGSFAGRVQPAFRS
jgi:hypothetical protein